MLAGIVVLARLPALHELFELRIEPLDTAELFDSVVNRFQWRAECVP